MFRPLGLAFTTMLSMAALIITATVADAMPGFARKYKQSCTTCHAPFPRLKPYGEEFAGRGFREEVEPARTSYDVGDPLLVLAREVPIGFRLEGFASVKEDAGAEIDQEFPWTWKILSGGPISETAAYYFYFIIERGEVEGLEDAYIQVNGIFGSPVDFMLGQFQVSDPMFKRETRLEREDYEIYTTEVGNSGLDLTYDRGIILSWESPGEIETLFQLVNGNGIPHADDQRDFDNDNYKNPSLRLARAIGDARVGVFGYYGIQEDSAEIENETTFFGADVSTPLGEKFQANLQYVERRDDNPFFAKTSPSESLETRGGFAEFHYFPEGENGRWAFTALYNYVDSDDEMANRESASLTANYLLARNLRLLVEGAYDVERELGRGTVGLIAGF